MMQVWGPDEERPEAPSFRLALAWAFVAGWALGLLIGLIIGS